MHVRQATLDDLDLLVPLFDGYRQFYEQPSDPALARAFLGERLARGDSRLFLAEMNGEAVGFGSFPLLEHPSPAALAAQRPVRGAPPGTSGWDSH
jgi:hypothetical protein